MNALPPTRILILGGGFGGVYTALTLEKILERELGRGDCFAEIALLGDHMRTASPHRLTNANVVAIDRDACQGLLSTLPPLRDFFNRLVEERVGMAPAARSDGYTVELVEQPQ